MRTRFMLSLGLGLLLGPPGAHAEPVVVLIGGNHSDPSPAQVAGETGRGGNSGLWRLKQDLKTAHRVPAEYFNWNGTRAGRIDRPDPGGAHRIAQLVREQHRPGSPVILVGNSWGGHTAWQVCRLLAGHDFPRERGTQRSIDASGTRPLISAGDADPADQSPGRAAATTNDRTGTGRARVGDLDGDCVIVVDLMILLDPSSFGRDSDPMPTSLPGNVRRVVNYHTRNVFGWREWIDDERVSNIDLGDPTSGYLVPDGPRYDAPLNWAAHVSAEWDERIHAAIRQQILATLRPGRETSGDSSGLQH